MGPGCRRAKTHAPPPGPPPGRPAASSPSFRPPVSSPSSGDRWLPSTLPRVRPRCPEEHPDAPGRWSTPCPPRPGRVGRRACSGGRGPWCRQGHQPERTDHGEGEASGVVVPSLVHSAAVSRRPGGSSPWCRGRAVTGQMAVFTTAETAPISSGCSSVGGWRPLPGALGRSPGLEDLLPVLLLLAIVSPPDVRSGGTGRRQAGWLGKLPLRPLRLVQRSTKGRGPGKADVLP